MVSGDSQGLTFDPVVEDYERGRAGWPAAVASGVEADHVLDLAAGCGKLTRVLVGSFAQVTAVEPLDAMRALGERLVPSARWLAGTAEAIPLRDGSVGAAFVAEAFHWFAPQQATSELARVLRPGSPLLVLFTVWDRAFTPEVPVGALEAIQEMANHTGPTGGPKWMTGSWRDGFAEAPFASLQEHEIPFEHITDDSGVISYYLSMSSIAARPAEEREVLRTTLRKLIPAGEYRLALRTRLYTTRRL